MDDFWNKVIWPVKQKMNFLEDTWAPVYGGKRTKNLLIPKKFGSGSVMIWSWFSANGVRGKEIIEGKKNVAKYMKIFSTHLFKSATDLENWTLSFNKTVISSTSLNNDKMV